MLRELDESGLSMAEFCRRRKLVYATVAAWRSVARRHRPDFVEVEVESAACAESSTWRPDPATLSAELLLPGGVVLRVFHNSGAVGGEL